MKFCARFCAVIKRSCAALVFLVLFTSLFSCAEKMDFGHAELRISLPKSFKDFEVQGFDKAYSDGESVVAIYRVSFEAGREDGIPDFLTTEQFARLYLKSTSRKAEIKNHNFTAYYEYTEPAGGENSSYLASFYRSKHAYFLVLFACPERLYSEKLQTFLSYTETVIFVY